MKLRDVLNIDIKGCLRCLNNIAVIVTVSKPLFATLFWLELLENSEEHLKALNQALPFLALIHSRMLLNQVANL